MVSEIDNIYDRRRVVLTVEPTAPPTDEAEVISEYQVLYAFHPGLTVDEQPTSSLLWTEMQSADSRFELLSSDETDNVVYVQCASVGKDGQVGKYSDITRIGAFQSRFWLSTSLFVLSLISPPSFCIQTCLP